MVLALIAFLGTSAFAHLLRKEVCRGGNHSVWVYACWSIFTFIAALGVVRLPDLFMRMHANTKSATLGVGFIMLGAAVYFAISPSPPAPWL
jgi:hypothetical protein